jgi:hypothetical protein
MEQLSNNPEELTWRVDRNAWKSVFLKLLIVGAIMIAFFLSVILWWDEGDWILYAGIVFFSMILLRPFYIYLHNPPITLSGNRIDYGIRLFAINLDEHDGAFEENRNGYHYAFLSGKSYRGREIKVLVPLPNECYDGILETISARIHRNLQFFCK